MSNVNQDMPVPPQSLTLPTTEATENRPRIIDIGERFQHRLRTLCTMLDQLGWEFMIENSDVSKEILAKNGLLPVLVWNAIVEKKAMGIPCPNVFMVSSPEALCDALVYQDATGETDNPPWDEWVMELLTRQRYRTFLTRGHHDGALDIQDFYDTWDNDVQNGTVMFRDAIDPKTIDPLVLNGFEHTDIPALGKAAEPTMIVCKAPVSSLRESEKWTALTTPLPLKTVNTNLSVWQDTLNARFPWMHALTARLFRSLYVQQQGGHALRLPCLALLGEPGFGKTLYLSEALRLLNHPWALLNLAGSNDSAMIKGTTAGWSSARPSFPSITVVTTRCANPVIVLDEIDKAGGSDENGRATDALLPMLEPGTASHYMDDGLVSTMDLSRISWLMTLNDETLVPGSLRSRMEIVPVDGPDWGNPEHLDAVLRMGEDLAWSQWPGQRTPACELTVEQKNDLRRVRWKSLRNMGTTIRSMIENNLYQASLEDLPAPSHFLERLATWRAGSEDRAPENTP